MFYQGKKVFITGGAGFIGHHLVAELIKRGARTTVADNLSTGSIDNVLRVWKDNGLRFKKTSWGYQTDDGHTFIYVDFQEYRDTENALKDNEIVFHLAANFGGRGYINTHPANCSECFSINQNVIKGAHAVGVDRVLFASTACIYPASLQKQYHSTYLLKEDDAFKNGWANADEQYGWSKLMGECTLQAYRMQYNLKSAITRYVTAYGPWENDTHAIIALIRRALDREDPFVVWGSGNQDRDFTYVDDIVSGTLVACEHVIDATAVNLGTSIRYTIKDVTAMIFDIVGWQPKKIIYDKTKPEGVRTRALDITRAKKLLDWTPQYSLREGLEKTIAWFQQHHPASVEIIR